VNSRVSAKKDKKKSLSKRGFSNRRKGGGERVSKRTTLERSLGVCRQKKLEKKRKVPQKEKNTEGMEGERTPNLGEKKVLPDMGPGENLGRRHDIICCSGNWGKARGGKEWSSPLAGGKKKKGEKKGAV